MQVFGRVLIGERAACATPLPKTDAIAPAMAALDDRAAEGSAADELGQVIKPAVVHSNLLLPCTSVRFGATPGNQGALDGQ
ncbi:MAG: hypothetical protein DCC58_12650 [Chloroflexi bacterium]|nr:MAG: hypothetical protein DCC58_12650 [Chloroflexota bacterium]